jgi:predicted amidophosphoribosyltransferase
LKTAEQPLKTAGRPSKSARTPRKSQTPLVLCRACERHVKSDARACPFCGSDVKASARAYRRRLREAQDACARHLELLPQD